jgi:serine protease inhibitor
MYILNLEANMGLRKKILSNKPLDRSVLAAPLANFGLKLFKTIAQQSPDQNIVVSPFSIASALAILYNGSEGSTRQAIARTLDFATVSQDTVNAAYAILLEELDRLPPQIVLTVMNKLEVPSDAAINSAFLQAATKFHKAEVVSSEAQNMMKVVNTAHFNGPWADPDTFMTTSEAPFTLPDGTQKPCSMMSSSVKEWAYYRHERFQLVALPYDDARMSMYILLSEENTGVVQLLELLTTKNWTRWLGSLSNAYGSIDLPRLDIDFTLDLRHVLNSLGMGIAFDPAQANFAAMCAPPAWIGRASHRAKITVDEKGTEASAETVFEMILGSAPSEFEMVMDRPFLFIIQDNLTELNLFMGLIVDPSPANSRTWGESRKEHVHDAIALIATSIEAGLSFDQALGAVYEKWDNLLTVSIGRAIQEIMLGKERHLALTDIAERIDMPDMIAFIEAVIKAERTGQSLAEVVRAQAERLGAGHDPHSD